MAAKSHAKTQLLQFRQTVQAPAAEVFRAFTRSTALREWFCEAAQADPRPGGRIYLWWHSGYYASGEFTALTPNKKVVFTWHGKGEPAPTCVTVTLAAKGDATRVTITHGEIGTGRAWAPVVSEFGSGWKVALENLASTLEAGPDLRLVRRPMLGVTGQDLTAQLAVELGTPASAGFRITGVLAGMAAEQAGLQSGDIATRVAGRKVAGFHTLAAALQGRQAGDVVPVVFYRGAEKKTVPLTLSARAQPRVPATAGEMADMAREMYAEQDAELIKCFEGTTEEAASRHPAPGEWSAKDILAHLILGEQGTFHFVADLVSGDEPVSDGFGDNVQAPLTALASIYRTAPELMEKLRYTEAEVVALLGALPPEFVARKSSYWRVGHLLSEMPLHYRDHIGQLRAALKAG
jgi:uncharacterized protein YndB with AHSA1/START domain